VSDPALYRRFGYEGVFGVLLHPICSGMFLSLSLLTSLILRSQAAVTFALVLGETGVELANPRAARILASNPERQLASLLFCLG
jgi:hypothetical protein